MKNDKQKKGHASPTPEKDTQLLVKEPAELLKFLLDQLSHRSRNSVKAILARGQVSVNDHVQTQYNFQLEPGQTVTIQWGISTKGTQMNGLEILHEDSDLIVIQKEAGLLSIASTKEKDLTAYRQLMEHVRKTHPKNRIFVVHRLDRDTSGVMMFAKSEKVQQLLQKSWKDTVTERTYIALVEGKVKKVKSTITSWLKENSIHLMYSSQKPNDGKKAITHYKVMKSNPNLSLLEVNLETGRKNQIRVHMQDIGHPVVGDKKYGSKTNVIGRLGLHAQVLAFKHPTTGKDLRFESDIPVEFLRPF